MWSSDLSELGFADPSLMIDLAMVAPRLADERARLRVRGAQPHIRRLIELVGFGNHLPGVLNGSTARRRQARLNSSRTL